MTSSRQTHLIIAALVFAAPLVWLAFQQGAAALVYFNCRAAAPPWSVLTGVVASVICAGVARLCWGRRSEGHPTARFLMQIAAGASAIFAVAAMAMTAALFLIPSCAR